MFDPDVTFNEIEMRLYIRINSRLESTNRWTERRDARNIENALMPLIPNYQRTCDIKKY